MTRVTITMSDGTTREVHPDTPVRWAGGYAPLLARYVKAGQVCDAVYEPAREDWTPYRAWMRDVLADDARVSWHEGGDDYRAPFVHRHQLAHEWDLRVHPDDAPERPAKEHPDEALAQTIADAFYEGDSYDAARAAREHIEAEREDGGCNIRRAERERKRRVKAEADLADMTRQRDKCATQAEKVKADRDEWREGAIRNDEDRNKWMSKHAEMRRERNEWKDRHEALRADVGAFSCNGSLPILSEEARDILDRDDERGQR